MVLLCDHTLLTMYTTLEPSLCSKQVLRAAKLAEVPRDIIDRNLKKATDKSQADYAEVCSKAHFPVQVLVWAWTYIWQLHGSKLCLKALS